MTAMDMTDHHDVMKQPTQALRAFLSPALQDKASYVQKLRMAEANDYIERTQATTRYAADLLSASLTAVFFFFFFLGCSREKRKSMIGESDQLQLMFFPRKGAIRQHKTRL